MTLFRSLRILGLLAALTGRELSAQGAPSGGQLHLDLSPVGLTFGAAKTTSPTVAIGASIGVGGNWVNYMLLGGSHFAESNGLSYDTKDGRTGKSLIELANATVFVRTYLPREQQLDVGLKVAGFAHFDSSDDEPGGGYFVGADVKYMWYSWRRLRVGSQVDIGRYAEGARGELGVNVSPLLLRVAF